MAKVISHVRGRGMAGWALVAGVFGILNPCAASAAIDPPPDVGAGLVAAARPGDYKLSPGPSEVGVTRLRLVDSARDGELQLLMRFPKAPGGEVQGDGEAAGALERTAHPLIIFSHGAGGSQNAFAELSQHWASHGYIVVHPTHSDSVELRRQQGERITSREQTIRGVRPLERIRDLRLILDSLDLLDEHLEGIASEAPVISREKIAMAGHSAGAMTTQMAAGARVVVPRRLRGDLGVDLREPRIRAAILISGQGAESRLFGESSWRDISIPMLVIAGSLDVVAGTPETPESRRHPFELAPGGRNDAYLVYIEGATHGSYAGEATRRILREGPVENIQLITEIVAASTTAFLDWHVQDDPGAGAYLDGEGLIELGEGRVEYLRK